MTRHGEFDLRNAVVYRTYGDALLQHYQKNTSLFGELITADENKLKKLTGKDEDDDADKEEKGAGQWAHADGW